MVTIGAADDNSLVLADRTVSRHHLELRWGHDGIQIADLGSRNGIFLGAARIKHAIVPPGTRLRVGETLVLIEHGDIIEDPNAATSTDFPGVIAESAAMLRLIQELTTLASSSVSILIQGETGTGKGLLARAVHSASARREGPFEVIDCGALAPTLIASALFGHEKGAFTGATERRRGAFERAHGGTVFLDEIGELPAQVAPALLGALQRRSFRRVGGTEEIAVDIRVLSATHRDLRAEVIGTRFRADLYYRLAVTCVTVPPLRDRADDIAPLVRHFVRELTGNPDPEPFGFHAMEALRAHPFRGNVRELRNVVESALALGRLTLDGTDQGDAAAAALDLSLSTVTPYGEARAHSLANFERAYLGNLIRRTKGNASAAARAAQMDRPYLLTLLRKHGLR